MTDPTPFPAIIYAAKSTEDKHGSIPAQLDDCRELAEREGWAIVHQDQDEGFSAYSGNRGPGLERARRAAADAAPSVLVVQHSDRLARGAGDAPGASQHLSEIIDWAIRSRVTIRTIQDDFYGDPRTARLMGAAMGQRNYEDSERKSGAVRDGLKRRKQSGKPVGPVPLGYVPQDAERVIDPATRGTVERIFVLVESGKTFGDVARTLNAEGIKTRPRKDQPNGSAWVSRTVRKIIENPAYKGEKGYEAIIEPARFDAIQASLARLDPVQAAKRKGGRKADESYFLRGLARCKLCNATLYTREQAIGRVYVCANRRQGTGLCDAPPIPAELIESHVLRHLSSFVGSVEGWIASQLADRDAEQQARAAAVERARDGLRTLDNERDKRLAELRKLDGDAARIEREVIARIDADRADQQRLIEDGEAVASEWAGPPDVDAALDYYGRPPRRF